MVNNGITSVLPGGDATTARHRGPALGPGQEPRVTRLTEARSRPGLPDRAANRLSARSIATMRPSTPVRRPRRPMPAAQASFLGRDGGDRGETPAGASPWRGGGRQAPATTEAEAAVDGAGVRDAPVAMGTRRLPVTHQNSRKSARPATPAGSPWRVCRAVMVSSSGGGPPVNCSDGFDQWYSMPEGAAARCAAARADRLRRA